MSALLPCLSSHLLLPHAHPQNVLELTLYDKDVLDSNQLCLLLFDLRSLKPGQPHRHTFLLNRQVSHPTCTSNEPNSRRGGPTQGTEVGPPS